MDQVSAAIIIVGAGGLRAAIAAAEAQPDLHITGRPPWPALVFSP